MVLPADRPVRKANGTRARQRAEARARLLGAAREVFEERGYLEVRVSDIAERAGVSHGLFYHYFDSKQQILRELAAAVDQQLSDPMEVIFDRTSAATPYERLQRALRLHLERYRAQARMMGVIEEVSRYDQGVSAAREERHRNESKRLSEAIGQLQRRGLADQRLDPTVAALALGSMTWRFAERWLVQGDLEGDFDQIVEQFTMIVLNSLQVREGPGSKEASGARAGPGR